MFPIIFAIGIAFGLAKDINNNGAAGLAGYIYYTIFTALLKSIDAEINMEVLAGIVSGITVGFLYNRFYKIQLPEFLGFFSGRRFVAIVTSCAAIILALIFSVIWLPIQNVINSFGLHHILNNPVYFVFGEFTNPVTSEIVRGDLTRFFAGDPTAGIFMTGGFSDVS